MGVGQLSINLISPMVDGWRTGQSAINGAASSALRAQAVERQLDALAAVARVHRTELDRRGFLTVALGGCGIAIRNTCAKEAVMNGWLIKISGWQGEGPMRLFAAAEPSPQLALLAVQKVTDAAPKLRVETVVPLSSQTIRQLGLESGQAFDLTS